MCSMVSNETMTSKLASGKGICATLAVTKRTRGRGQRPRPRMSGIDVDQKSFFVEQEGAKDSLASAKADYDYLSKLEF